MRTLFMLQSYIPHFTQYIDRTRPPLGPCEVGFILSSVSETAAQTTIMLFSYFALAVKVFAKHNIILHTNTEYTHTHACNIIIVFNINIIL